MPACVMYFDLGRAPAIGWGRMLRLDVREQLVQLGGGNALLGGFRDAVDVLEHAVKALPRDI